MHLWAKEVITLSFGCDKMAAGSGQEGCYGCINLCLSICVHLYTFPCTNVRLCPCICLCECAFLYVRSVSIYIESVYVMCVLNVHVVCAYTSICSNVLMSAFT